MVTDDFLRDFNINNNTFFMFDDDDNEYKYQLLAIKKHDDCVYMLAEEVAEEVAEASEVLLFKCVEDNEAEEMVFEMLTEEHTSFDFALELFKNDIETIGIEY